MLTETLVLIIPVILIFIGYLLKKYYFYGHSCKLKKKLHGKIAIVTGANSGIGFETAMDFAHRGATVILACRDIEKAYKASSKIVVSSRNENVFADRLDLADLDSIRSFAERFMNRFSRLDLLVNNAGAFNKNYRKTVDGFEMSFGVMHLGHFYLTNLLLEHLKKSAPSRIINVSSDMHRGIEIRWKNIQLENDYNPIFAYRQAKLANILFTLELSKRLKDTNVSAVSLNPGFVSTEIYRDFEQEDNTLKSNLFNSLFKFILRSCAQDCKQGAQTTIFCALVDDLEIINGKYFSNCEVSICSKQGEDEEAAKQLWDLSAKLVKLN